MADSNITKCALASALRKLMETRPFAKITVADICDACGMNRKSFYYHFRDKYDLVNWIYDTEFIAVIHNHTYDSVWSFLRELCGYLYENRSFYRRAFQIKGQNSFSDHFRELMLPLIAEYLRDTVSDQESVEFHVNFFADAFVCCVERWIQEPDCVEPDQLLANAHTLLVETAQRICRETEQKSQPPTP